MHKLLHQPLRRKIVLAPNFSKPLKSKAKKDSVNNACDEVAKLNGKVQDLKIEDVKIKEKNKKVNSNFGSNTGKILSFVDLYDLIFLSL